MRAALCLLALAIPLGAAARADNDCDCKTLEKGWYCSKCDALVEKDDLDKDGKHKDCKEKAAEVKVCLKTYFEAPCDGTKHADAGSWWGQSFVEKTSKARVVFKCKECKTEGKEGAKCAKKGCKGEGKELVPVCTKTGTFPHGGSP